MNSLCQYVFGCNELIIAYQIYDYSCSGSEFMFIKPQNFSNSVINKGDPVSKAAIHRCYANRIHS